MESNRGNMTKRSPENPVKRWTAQDDSVFPLSNGDNPQICEEKANESDCKLYMKNGACSPHNDPTDRSAAFQSIWPSGGNHPKHEEHVDQSVCLSYIWTGKCKSGARCKYHHPKPHKEKVVLNAYGYPLRPGRRDCFYYEKTGYCKYGASCIFNHSQQIQALIPAQAPVPVPPSAPAPYPSLAPAWAPAPLSALAPTWAPATPPSLAPAWAPAPTPAPAPAPPLAPGPRRGEAEPPAMQSPREQFEPLDAGPSGYVMLPFWGWVPYPVARKILGMSQSSLSVPTYAEASSSAGSSGSTKKEHTSS